MFGYLKGQVAFRRGAEVWVVVGGVGYRVKMHTSKFKKQNGEGVELFIHTAVRENDISLYGFETMEELQLFELLLTVSGVGAKTAQAIVGDGTVDQIGKAIREADVGFFTRVPGIGKKGAQRIIVDLKGKLGSLKELDFSEDGEVDEVTMALMQFGFKKQAIDLVVAKLNRDLSVEERVREALQRLGKRI